MTIYAFNIIDQHNVTFPMSGDPGPMSATYESERRARSNIATTQLVSTGRTEKYCSTSEMQSFIPFTCTSRGHAQGTCVESMRVKNYIP